MPKPTPFKITPNNAPASPRPRGDHGHFLKGKGQGGRPKGAKNYKPQEIKEIAYRILLGDTPEAYIKNIRGRILSGDAPHMEKFFGEHLWGKPKEHVEVSGTLTLAHVLAERLMTAKERALVATDREHFPPGDTA